MRTTTNNPVVGIIAEYNPFHAGHRYHIEESVRRTGAGAVVVAMSGNFVQRGEPAVLDKWLRAEIALTQGVDVVLEIPVPYCLGNASIYAAAGTHLLEAAGFVTHLSFGSESGDLEALHLTADVMREREEEIRDGMGRLLRSGLSWPAARARVLREILPEGISEPGPNDTLALEYLRALKTLEPVAVPRLGSGYHEGQLAPDRYPSSTGLRAALRQGERVPSGFLPGASLLDPSDWNFDPERWFDLIRYRLLTIAACDIDLAPGGGEGIGNRLKDAARRASSLEELIRLTKSRRYTYTRISRLLYQLLLGIRQEDVSELPSMIRILGFTEKGQALLREARKEKRSALPIVTNVNHQSVPDSFSLECRSTDLYNLANGRNLSEYAERRQQVRIVHKNS